MVENSYEIPQPVQFKEGTKGGRKVWYLKFVGEAAEANGEKDCDLVGVLLLTMVVIKNQTFNDCIP